MSNFYCFVCKKAIIDTPGGGYISHCPHFPRRDKKVEPPDFMKEFLQGFKK